MAAGSDLSIEFLSLEKSSAEQSAKGTCRQRDRGAAVQWVGNSSLHLGAAMREYTARGWQRLRVAGYIFLFVLLFVVYRVTTKRHETTAHDGWATPLTVYLQSLPVELSVESHLSPPLQGT